jgi:hypothetical protein
MHAGVTDLGFAGTVPADVDQRVILSGVTWKQYETLLELFADDQPGFRVAYLEGELEIMSPSRKHERIKTTVGRLVELYALERDIPLTGLGSTPSGRPPRSAARSLTSTTASVRRRRSRISPSRYATRTPGWSSANSSMDGLMISSSPSKSS